jgi:hypothetical protein
MSVVKERAVTINVSFDALVKNMSNICGTKSLWGRVVTFKDTRK